MKSFLVKLIFFFSCIFFLVPGLALSADLNRLFKQVEKLKLQRQGYVLGGKLNKAQLATAKANPITATTPDTFKFKDNNLFVVAHSSSNRVLVLYEQIEEAGLQNIKNLVGDLYMTFDDPTVMAHDKIIYWAWAKKGKISTQEFDTAKEKKKKLDILATVKCVSDIPIMEAPKDLSKGNVYYIISSDPVLNYFTGQNT